MNNSDFPDTLTPAILSKSIDDYHHLSTAGFILIYAVGFFLFEYGAVRSKNAETVLIKTMVIFCFSCFAVYSLGYAFAYGSTYFIGLTFYFTSFSSTDQSAARPI